MPHAEAGPARKSSFLTACCSSTEVSGPLVLPSAISSDDIPKALRKPFRAFSRSGCKGAFLKKGSNFLSVAPQMNPLDYVVLLVLCQGHTKTFTLGWTLHARLQPTPRARAVCHCLAASCASARVLNRCFSTGHLPMTARNIAGPICDALGLSRRSRKISSE
jgi:hypothetical protein